MSSNGAHDDQPMIRLDELTKRFPGQETPAVDALDLEIPDGERTARTACVETKQLLAERIIEFFRPLRARRDDIPDLVWSLIKLHQHDLARDVTTVPEDVMEALAGYDWPGNVRELENVLERAFALNDSGVIGAEEIRLRRSQRRPEADSVGSDEPLPDVLNDVERQAIQKALRETNGNRTAAARLLGMTFRQLRYRLEKLDIKPEGPASGKNTAQKVTQAAKFCQLVTFLSSLFVTCMDLE